MKRRIGVILISTISIIIIVLLIITCTNKTYFKKYYIVTNPKGDEIKIPVPLFSYYNNVRGKYNVTFSTSRSVKNIRNILSKYVENLKSCYDESYFYDKNLDITISKYQVEEGSPFNKIYLTYTYGNYCENEYVLDDNWMTELNEKAVMQEAVISEDIINSKKVSYADVKSLLDYISKPSVARIENKNNIDENGSKYLMAYYYKLNRKSYVLSVFVYNNYLAFKVIDANDHGKNAIYNVGDNANKLLEDIYNKSI